MYNPKIIRSDRGQTIIVFAIVVPILALFAGMAVDTGLLYVTKAKLSTSVDAACLTGMKNLVSGQPTALTLAQEIFNANYGANPPIPTITFPTDTYGNQQVKVTATVSVNTLFMQYLSQWASVPVSATAVSTRGKLIMSLVLDRSGSMGNDGGETALKAAVPEFVDNFNDSLDEVAMISFSSNSTIDSKIGTNFTAPITAAVAAMSANGGTFGTGAGTQAIKDTAIGAPLSLAQNQNDSVTILQGQNAVKVVVYFTDGLMNAVQDKFHCGGTSNNTLTLINYGGHDSPDTTVAFMDPTQPATVWYTFTPNSSTYFYYDSTNDKCKDSSGNYVTTFTPQQGSCADASSPPCQFSRTNVTGEAQYRAAVTANAMRTETVPTFIFSIGLGSGVSSTTQAFLAQLANDPAYPLTYIKGQPAGKFFYIQNCPSTTCTTDLKTAFQTIASKVLLRLTQ